MRRVLLCITGGLAITATAVSAQTQSTLGPCSPAIAGVKGDVAVTCITGDQRIRIAKYEGQVDTDTGLSFATFVEANFGQIVHVAAYTDGFSKLYDKEGGYLKVASAPECRDTVCPDGTIIYFNEIDKPSTAYWSHGTWGFQGYYLIGCGGFGQ